MKSCPRKTALTILIAGAILLFLGCGGSAHTKAITDAVIAYSDYYIEVRNLSDQVLAQESAQDRSATSLDYVISVDIPDYSQISPSAIGFALPNPDVATRSANTYQRQSVLALRQAMEQYAMQHPASAYISLPVTFSVNSEGGRWSANMTSQSKLDIQQRVDGMILSILQQDSAFAQNDRLMQAASALPSLLSETFGGKEYANLLDLFAISTNPDGSFSAEFFYPDAQSVYRVLREAYENSFNQSFYGSERVAQLTTEGIKELDLSSLSRNQATVTIGYDETTQAFTLLEDGGLGETILAAKAQAEQAASDAVNSKWRIEPNTPPANASVLAGESRGNQIVFKTGTSLGKYYYVRFFAISGEDTSEEGTLQLGVFVVGGKSAKVKLPTGYYRITCDTGESWYGIEHRFGSDMKTYNGGSAIQSRNGYINTITFE